MSEELSKAVNLVEEMYHQIESYDMEECDPDVAIMLYKAQKFLEQYPVDADPVDEENIDEWLEDVRAANVNPLAP